MAEGEPQGRVRSPGPYGNMNRDRNPEGGRNVGNDLSTTAGRIAENEARTTRNEERAQRREEGEEDVEEDEPLLDPIEQEQEQAGSQTQSTTVPTPAQRQSSSADAMARLLASASDCGPELFERTLACVEKWTGVTAQPAAGGHGRGAAGHSGTVPRRIGDVKGPDLFDRKQVDADPKLHAVLELGFHLPLTLCTTEALEAVARGTKQLEMATHWHSKDRQKRSVVDVRLWPAEDDMSSDEWRDAWPNYLEVLREVCEQDVYERFKQHYEFLSRQANFKTRFPGILRFDIAVRRAYFVNAKYQPFVVGSTRYCQELTQACSDQAVERMERLQERAGPSSVRYHPYERGMPTSSGGSGYRSDRGIAGSGSRSFQGGRSSGSAGLLCLICGTSGHKADDCTRSKTVKGRPVYAVWAERKLRAEIGGRELCIRWNIRGPAGCQRGRCPTASDGGHACSFCGSSSHHAASKQCIQ
ncbi:hypothetical protein OH76DRAFT_630510 [Lentinus brumalis]|uniref:CCHC-type domain-containing protein n=1 Tax=Lentinus brumalis TaxID=2498619 RepID=A0A371D8G5_9APHY|nr:hypothetical protein OH76DRAFT_630510 [Polyporus brumalis]